MTDVKFECPFCGQNLECNRACGGDVIHCPRCCAEIRVPFSTPTEIEGSLLRAELISPPAAPAEAPHQPSNKPVQPAEVICPACQARLRVPLESPNQELGEIPVAELVRRGFQVVQKPDAKPAEPAHPDFAHMSADQKERYVAHARETHPVQLHAPMKPRLDYVLSGEPPQVPPAVDGAKTKIAPKKLDKSQKSFNE